MDCDEIRCCVCHQNYGEDNIPRNLSCGHSVCSTCIKQLILRNKKCPECRETFSQKVASELPINYSLLMVSRLLVHEDPEQGRLSTVRIPLSFPAHRLLTNAGPCPTHGHIMFFMCMRCRMLVCYDCITENHPGIPLGRCFIMDTGEAIRTIKKTLAIVREQCIIDSCNTGEKLEKLVQRLCLTQRFFKTSRHSESTNSDSDLETLISITKTTVNRLATLNSAQLDLEEKFKKLDSHASPPDIIILEKELIISQINLLKLIEEESAKEMPDILSILLGKKTDLKELVKSEKTVYAVTDEETVRCASVAIKNGHLHLYSLRKSKPPKRKVCLPYELVRDLVPTMSPTIFLEVGWAGKVKDCVYVRMLGDTPRSQQTVLLCSGEKGPSYRNTCFYEVNEFENGCHILSGGDYENNDGSGGQAIVEGIISGGPYCHEVKAGLFVSWPATEHWHLGSFDIYLKDTPGVYDYSSHGIVEQGLEILQEIANIKPISKASVMDCGLVIPIES